MNTMLNGLKNTTNYTLTENGAITHKTTRSDLLDMFAMGAAMRNRSEADVILMFRKAGHGGQGPLHELKDFADGVFFRPPAEPVTSAFSADAFQKTAGHHILDNDFEVFF